MKATHTEGVFSRKRDTPQRLNNFRLIRRCAKYVSDHKSHFVDDDADGAGMESIWIRGWFPVLFELSCIINTSKLDIRTRSLTILFDVVKNYGDQFERSWWLDLFRVLFRVFDIVKKGDLPKVRCLSKNKINCLNQP